MRKVLILDANQRSALAATRALGRRGVWVVAAGETRKTLAGVSKYCKERFVYPSPSDQVEAFVAAVHDEAMRRHIEVILPMTDLTTGHLLRAGERFGTFSMPVGELESYEALSDKWRVSRIARELGIPHPETHLARNTSEAVTAGRRLGFPVVVKPRQSVMAWNGQWVSAPVSCARSGQELEEVVERYPSLRVQPFLVQQYIEGEGRGVCALYRNGEPVAFFSHRRVRERPPSGGVSVLSESIPLDPYQRQCAQALLDHTKWHGVAMVEFKISREGVPYLLEVNARFWGSLQLAVDAGVDFPYLLYRLASGEPLNGVGRYQVGVRSRWFLGDLDRLYLIFRSRSWSPVSRWKRWKTLVEFLRLYSKGTRYDVNRWDDIRPFVLELRRYLRP